MILQRQPHRAVRRQLLCRCKSLICVRSSCKAAINNRKIADFSENTGNLERVGGIRALEGEFKSDVAEEIKDCCRAQPRQNPACTKSAEASGRLDFQWIRGESNVKVCASWIVEEGDDAMRAGCREDSADESLKEYGGDSRPGAHVGDGKDGGR